MGKFTPNFDKAIMQRYRGSYFAVCNRCQYEFEFTEDSFSEKSEFKIMKAELLNTLKEAEKLYRKFLFPCIDDYKNINPLELSYKQEKEMYYKLKELLKKYEVK